ncbi:MAG: SH3 domain-containing protein [Symploca sp. SIO3C6]|uniref:SH3 domain-containing protein n=1 Tax=Symploca sp. SIO1C4 TaxID=2607765 RepID=A0A6B3NDN9_9CYAN|nr:SH3 domain-containing protein [Symploca sp. SIO3C6]NER29015.1 SH3 domain-containing protein [Symploca sp. SIO1C4]NET05275.1 SH3 domain-containing protein [Symploca sp. SIO2B6]
MKNIGYCGKHLTLLALVLSTLGGIKTDSAVAIGTNSIKLIPASELTSFNKESNWQLAQGLSERCRAAAKSIFVYRERSDSEPIRALLPDEQVILAQETSRDGWIAISSPISGFVETTNLKFCSTEVPIPLTTTETFPLTTKDSNLCRQVIYDRPEGLVIRQRPNSTSRTVGEVFFGQRVLLVNPPKFREDQQGREWARLSFPIAGWVSNGFPAQGGTNLRACFFLEN